MSKLQERALSAIAQTSAPFVIGLDEVGRGAWAGPLVVCGVVALKGWSHPNVKDSKKYNSDNARRRALFNHIEPDVKMKHIGERSPEEIDRYGLEICLQSLNTDIIQHLLLSFPDSIVVGDGNTPPKCSGAHEVVCLPKADVLVPAVSAASVVAKVFRDAHMQQHHHRWPDYDFFNNKGYRSETHVEALQLHGPCDIHRFSFRPVKNAARTFDPNVSAYT